MKEYGAKQVFQAAFALVSNPDTWTNGASARNEAGEYTWRDAVRFSAYGALIRANPCWLTYVSRRLMQCPPDQYEPAERALVEFAHTASHEDCVRLYRECGEREGWLK
jgi:hypothetical protein